MRRSFRSFTLAMAAGLSLSLLTMCAMPGGQAKEDATRYGSYKISTAAAAEVRSFGHDASCASLGSSKASDSQPISKAIITIVDSNGRVVQDSEVVEFLRLGAVYFSQSIQLPVGDYRLTRFLVADSSNEISYATPCSPSDLEDEVADPLPIDFTIVENATVDIIPEILEVGEYDASDFGYAGIAWSFTVTFHKNDQDAIGTMGEQVFSISETKPLTECAFSKQGWRFMGWATSSEGEVVYADQADFRMGTADATLYAKWEPYYGADRVTNEAIVLSSGKLLIGGGFDRYNGIDVPDGLIRLNSDGSFDSSFNDEGSGFANTADEASCVEDIALQGEKIIVGGSFADYNGRDVSDNLVRLNEVGSIDASFNAGGSGFNGPVYCIALLADSKMLVFGNFTTYNGSPVPGRLVLLGSNGNLDSSFTGNLPAGTIKTMALQSDGKVLIGGIFATFNGVDVPDHIMRLNADLSIDSDFNPDGSGFVSAPGNISGVEVIELQADGKILVGGCFNSYNGSNQLPSGIARLNGDGSIDTSFNAGGAGIDDIVYAMDIQADGKIVIGGRLEGYNQNTGPSGLLRTNSDGSFDGSFNSNGIGYNSNAHILSLACQGDGRIAVCGLFASYNGVDAPDNLMRLESNGSIDYQFNKDSY